MLKLFILWKKVYNIDRIQNSSGGKYIFYSLLFRYFNRYLIGKIAFKKLNPNCISIILSFKIMKGENSTELMNKFNSSIR